MNTKRSSKSAAVRFLEKTTGGPLTLRRLLRSIRVGERRTLAESAALLGVTRQHLCDIEQGRKSVSPERAARFATALGYSRELFVALALQALVDEAGLRFKVVIQTV